jgi:hypothetical protein
MYLTRGLFGDAPSHKADYGNAYKAAGYVDAHIPE